MDQENITASTSGTARRPVQKDGNTNTSTGKYYALELIVPVSDGIACRERDFRAPLSRITCPTCVARTGESRMRRKFDALEREKDAKPSRYTAAESPKTTTDWQKLKRACGYDGRTTIA